MSAIDDLQLQDDWDAQPLRDHWKVTPDLRFAFGRFSELAVEATATGATGEVLEVAAAEGVHACNLRGRGLAACILEPSPTMLERARARQQRLGMVVPLVRGVAEAAPFQDGAFDRVLCDSALDHLADPERGIREMARITAPTGRVVLTFVNYGSATVRASRVLYGLGRRLRLLPTATERQLFWDTPVPYEHTFECTLDNVRAMCGSYLELEHAWGVSLGCQFPGWGRLLERLPGLHRLLPRLDRFAAQRPSLADYVVTVWRPKPQSEWIEAKELRVQPTNPVHRRLVAEEARWWATTDFNAFFARAIEGTRELRNRVFTGRPDRDWLDDLLARGPFPRAAMLGCDVGLERRWLTTDTTSTLDVYELSTDVIARARAGLGDVASRARFIATDLNFVRLPEAAYDVIWTSDCLHCITNLEHLFTQIARALRPGGLFALAGYVGEARMQYDPHRLAHMNAVLASLPARFRLTDAVTAPKASSLVLSPFAAVRAPDVLPLVRRRFEVVHEAEGGRLFPLHVAIDWEAVSREGALSSVLGMLAEAETAAAADPRIRACVAYGVYRLHSGSSPK